MLTEEDEVSIARAAGWSGVEECAQLGQDSGLPPGFRVAVAMRGVVDDDDDIYTVGGEDNDADSRLGSGVVTEEFSSPQGWQATSR